jgi:hypothetical protein
VPDIAAVAAKPAELDIVAVPVAAIFKDKGLDAFGDLPDLLFAVAPRVSRVPFELVERAVDDLTVWRLIGRPQRI